MKVDSVSNHENIIERIKLVIVVIIGIMLVLVQLFFLFRGSKYVKYDLTKDVVVKHNGKQIFRGNIDELRLEKIESEDNLTMYMKIPKNSIVNPAIQYDNINTAVKVYLDGKKIYSIGEDTPKGGIVCHVFNKVSLGDISNSEEIVMSIRVMNNSTLTRLPRVTLMNTYDIDEEYLSNYFSTIESKNIIIKLASNKEIMIPFDEFSHILKSERSKVSFVIFKCKEDTK